MMQLQNAIARLKQSGTASQYLIVTEVQREVQRLADAYDRVEKTLKETQDAAYWFLDSLQYAANTKVSMNTQQKITALRNALDKSGYRHIGRDESPLPPPKNPNGRPDHIADADKMVLDDPHPPHRLCECTACLEYWTPKPTCDHIAGGGKVILTAEQAQQIEEALLSCEIHDDGEIRYSTFDNDKIWGAIDTIRKARAQERETVVCESCGETIHECQIAGETESGGTACADCCVAFWIDRVAHLEEQHGINPAANFTLTTEQAQQIKNAFSFAESQADYPPDGLMLYHEALYTIRAARAQELVTVVKPWAYGGSTGVNDYLMSDGSIRALTPDEVKAINAAPVSITTPDVCGEVCARAKLCYGCGKALDEANVKLAEQTEQKPTDCPCCGANGTVIPSAFCRECKSDFWPPSVPVKPDRAAKEHKVMEGFDRSKYTPEQWEWCVKYENRTGFDPMMEDFEAGIKTFYEAAQHACAWYDDHTGDAHNAVTRNIPGDPIEG